MDTADKLIACAEQATFFSSSIDREREGRLVTKDTGGSEDEKEKFTTETGMVSSTNHVTVTVEWHFLQGELWPPRGLRSYELDDWGSVPSMGQNFLFSAAFRPNRVHPASYVMGSGGSFPRGKLAGV
jgi:hypothetical protein